MAGGNKIGNPLGAYGQLPTPTAYTMECVVGTGGCAPGDVVALTLSLTTGVWTATKAPTAGATTGIYGVAEGVGVVGNIVKVTMYGPTFVNGGGNTFAAGDAFFRSAATAGIADRVVPDATTIVGTMIGTVIGIKSATVTGPYPFANAVPVWVGKF